MGKLVRDLIPDIMRANGLHPETRVLDNAEYEASLAVKLVEEAEELRDASPEQLLDEAADVYEVLLAITRHAGIPMDKVIAKADGKRRQRGTFDERLWLE